MLVCIFSSVVMFLLASFLHGFFFFPPRSDFSFADILKYIVGNGLEESLGHLRC